MTVDRLLDCDFLFFKRWIVEDVVLGMLIRLLFLLTDE